MALSATAMIPVVGSAGTLVKIAGKGAELVNKSEDATRIVRSTRQITDSNLGVSFSINRRNAASPVKNNGNTRLLTEPTPGDNVAINLRSKDTVNAPHGNSKNSTKPQHGYEISEKETGDVSKTGISGQPLNKNGTSPRANSQVNKWNGKVGYEKYEADVVKLNIPNRQEALDWERKNAQRLWEEGNSMNKHQRPKPWEE